MSEPRKLKRRRSQFSLRTLMLLVTLALCLAGPLIAADKSLVVDLWPGKVPDAIGNMGEEKILMSPRLDRNQVEVCTDKAFEEGGCDPTDTGVGPGSEPLMKAAILKLLGGK